MSEDAALVLMRNDTNHVTFPIFHVVHQLQCRDLIVLTRFSPNRSDVGSQNAREAN
jgi:hypothetical protein